MTFAVLLLAAGGYAQPSAPRLTADAGILVGSGLASREEYDRAYRSWRSVGAALGAMYWVDETVFAEVGVAYMLSGYDRSTVPLRRHELPLWTALGLQFGGGLVGQAVSLGIQLVPSLATGDRRQLVGAEGTETGPFYRGAVRLAYQPSLRMTEGLWLTLQLGAALGPRLATASNLSWQGHVEVWLRAGVRFALSKGLRAGSGGPR